MSGDPFAPLSGGSSKPSPAARRWASVTPVPEGAPAAPRAHPKLGAPTTVWAYTDAAGALLGYVMRFDLVGGEKEFRPLIYMRCEGTTEWRWQSWPPKRPLYGLRSLATKPDALVVVTEGEKAADAATALLPDVVVLTSPNGSKSAGHADWSPLKGRAVVIWPDADVAGLEYANEVSRLAGLAGAKSVAITSPPADVASGWDAADAAAEGWSAARAALYLKSARPLDPSAGSGGGGNGGATDASGHRRRTPQRDVLIGLTDAAEFWHDANRNAYATFPVNDHLEHWPVRSREFRMWLSGRFYDETGSAIGGQALEDGIRILEARAVNDGPQHEPYIRVGRNNGAIYVDLADAGWRAVEVTALGWKLVERPPLKLLRSNSMRALPPPEAGGLIEELRRFVNTRNDDEFMLVVAYLVAALREHGPYPVLVVNGEQGSGKSVFSRMLRSLIDPSAAPIRAVPKDDRDLVVSAGNSWLLAFDNLSSVPNWLSDAFCRLATGGGFATRMLHTDRDEMIFEASRPILLNGIPLLTDRADLADRAVNIHLATIPEEEREPEDELAALFELKRPLILGALFDAVAAALRNIDKVKVGRSPRMADFVKWITAAEGGLGWEAGQFMQAYRDNRHDVTESSFEANPVAVAIKDYITTEHPTGWTGTATELFSALNNRVTDGVRRSRIWPQTAQALGNAIDRVAPLLRGKGFAVEKRHSGVRTITIVPPR